MAGSRERRAQELLFFNPKAPRGDQGEVLFNGKDRRAMLACTEPHQVTILDARDPQHGGLQAWKFEEHGFCFIPAPEPVRDFLEPALIRTEYVSRVVETVRRHTGARRVFFMSHMIRGADPNGRVFPYAGFTHADYGPEFEPLFRRMLMHREGLPEAEALGCGLCAANLWVPAGRPAYKNPICLLDGSSLKDWETETIRFTQNGDLHYSTNRPGPERVPRSAQDAPAIGPLPAPHHRWVYCPDMRTQEAALFKQYDFRGRKQGRGGGAGLTTGGKSGAVCSFHSSFPDDFHEAWRDCPSRLSIECRLLLAFDAEEPEDAAMMLESSNL